MTAEERYDIECQINALYDEAEYAEDHNNYWKANSLKQEADELQKKLDADTSDTNECLSENCDPFDVDWSNKKYVERRKQSKGIKEGCTRNLKESSARVGYIVGSFGGEGDHEFHYVGYDYNEARTLWQDERDDWVSLGLSGGDTYLIFAQYINNDPTAFDSLYQEWMADPDSVDTDDYDILDEYSWEIIDKVLDEDYTGNPEERTDHLDYVDDNSTDDKFKFPKNITKKEDDHCKKSNPVVNHDPDDKDVLNEDWRDDVGLAPMWCCKNCKDLYEYIKKHGDADAKDKTFAKLAREAVKQLKQKYGVSNQEAAEIIARGQAIYKFLFENLNEAGLKNGRYVRDGFGMMCDLDKGGKKVNLKAISDKNLLIYRNVCNTWNLKNALQKVEAEIARRGITEDLHKDKSLKEDYQTPSVDGYRIEEVGGEFEWEEYSDSYCYVDVYPEDAKPLVSNAVTFTFSGPHGSWYCYDFSATDWGYSEGRRNVELELTEFTPDYSPDDLERRITSFDEFDSEKGQVLNDDQAMKILGVGSDSYSRIVDKAAEEACDFFNRRAEEYLDDNKADVYDWDHFYVPGKYDDLDEEFDDGDDTWAVCIDPDGDSDWTDFDSEVDAKDYFYELVDEAKADLQNFGSDYTVQLWHADECVLQFSTNPDYNEV